MELTDRELEILQALERRPRRVLGDPDRPGMEQAYVAALMQSLLERGLVESGPGRPHVTEVRRLRMGTQESLVTQGAPVTEYQLTEAGREAVRAFTRDQSAEGAS